MCFLLNITHYECYLVYETRHYTAISLFDLLYLNILYNICFSYLLRTMIEAYTIIIIILYKNRKYHYWTDMMLKYIIINYI